MLVPLNWQQHASPLLFCLLHSVLALLLQSGWRRGVCVALSLAPPLTYFLVNTCLTPLKAIKTYLDLRAHSIAAHVSRNMNAHQGQPRAWDQLHREGLLIAGEVKLPRGNPINTPYKPLGPLSLKLCNFWSISFTFWVSALFQNLHIILKFLYYTILYSQSSNLLANATRLYSQTENSWIKKPSLALLLYVIF